MSIGHYENFPVASRLVPQALRSAIVAIYAFARSADDFADEGDDPPSARLSRLDAYAAQLDRIERGDVPPEAPFPALAAAIGRHALPIGCSFTTSRTPRVLAGLTPSAPASSSPTSGKTSRSTGARGACICRATIWPDSP